MRQIMCVNARLLLTRVVELRIHVLMAFVSVVPQMHVAYLAKRVSQERVNVERLLHALGWLLDLFATQQIMYASAQLR